MDLCHRAPGLEMCNLSSYLSLLKGRGGDISTDTWEVSGNPLVMPRHSLQQGLLTQLGWKEHWPGVLLCFFTLYPGRITCANTCFLLDPRGNGPCPVG